MFTYKLLAGGIINGSKDEGEAVFQKNRKKEGEYEPMIILRDVRHPRKKYSYHLKGCMVIGRDHILCDIAFPENRTVSGRQCRIYTEDGAVYLMDLEGTNTTYVNGEKVTQDVILHSGDMISFGDADYYITIRG